MKSKFTPTPLNHQVLNQEKIMNDQKRKPDQEDLKHRKSGGHDHEEEARGTPRRPGEVTSDTGHFRIPQPKWSPSQNKVKPAKAEISTNERAQVEEGEAREFVTRPVPQSLESQAMEAAINPANFKVALTACVLKMMECLEKGEEAYLIADVGALSQKTEEGDFLKEKPSREKLANQSVEKGRKSLTEMVFDGAKNAASDHAGDIPLVGKAIKL